MLLDSKSYLNSFWHYYYKKSRNSAVVITTGYRQDDQAVGVRVSAGRETILLMVPTQDLSNDDFNRDTSLEQGFIYVEFKKMYVFLALVVDLCCV
jgi:hypothetical protein